MQSSDSTKVDEKMVTNEKDDSDLEEMEHDSDDSDHSGSGSGDSSEGSESDEASELDEEYVRRRQMYLDQMNDLEKQFMDLHEVEKLTQIEKRLTEIRSEEAREYILPLSELEDNMKIRLEVAGVLRQFRLKSIENQYDAEELTAKQNFENEKNLLYDSIEDDLKERIKHLEEDRNNVDLNADLWMVERGLSKPGKLFKDKKHITSLKGSILRGSETNPRRKPVTVSGPYIVYMLHDSEILEDWTTIKKALSNCNRKCTA